MKEIIEKLSSYNIFNYLLPGIVFSILASKYTSTNLIFDNLIIGAFLYYFIGLIISSVGSTIIEPLLKWMKFIKFADYKDFVNASKTDNKLEVLSEANNMYRTFISMFSILFLIIGFQKLSEYFIFLKDKQDLIVLIVLFLLFLLSYRKQTNYITKRIKASK
jgi:hypothetical protein